MSNEWFTPRDTYERPIVHPESGAEATVTYRPLNAGDRAELNEMRVLDDGAGGGEGRYSLAQQQLRATEMAVVAWTLPGPSPTPESIRQLDPKVFDLIYKHVSFGKPKSVAEAAADPLADANATSETAPEPTGVGSS